MTAAIVLKKMFALLCLGFLMGLTVVLSACEPEIPHPIEGRSDCISCHGQNGVKSYPKFHAERGYDNDACTKCHKLASNTST